MNIRIVFAILFFSFTTFSQELFVYTEPASNMATNNLAVRLMTISMKNNANSGAALGLIPEVMYGFSNKIMVNAAAFTSNKSDNLKVEGGSFYAKYKFLNQDAPQEHFRMAYFGRFSYNSSEIHQEDINLYGQNSGFENGLIATQLLHKYAINTSVSYANLFTNNHKIRNSEYHSNSGANYSISVGKLVLPKKYVSYNQPNLNLMCEFLGQSLIQNGRSYLDVAPSIQLIFKSKIRVDFGYRQQLYSSVTRNATNGFLFRLEYNWFNTF